MDVEMHIEEPRIRSYDPTVFRRDEEVCVTKWLKLWISSCQARYMGCLGCDAEESCKNAQKILLQSAERWDSIDPQKTALRRND